jgi:hypothetical protein
MLQMNLQQCWIQREGAREIGEYLGSLGLRTSWTDYLEAYLRKECECCCVIFTRFGWRCILLLRDSLNYLR